MPAEIPTGTNSYFVDFAGGQGLGKENYFTYAADQDTNFVLIRSTINELIQSISAVSGPNAQLGVDLVTYNDENRAGGAQNSGFIGEHSYRITIDTPTTGLLIRKGSCMVLGQRGSILADLAAVQNPGPAGAGTRFLAWDANGSVFLSDLANQKSIDFATMEWDGAAWTGSPTYLASTFFDGDAYFDLLNRPVSGATFPAQVFRKAADRLRDIELVVGGAGPSGALVAPAGVVGTPGLIFDDAVGGEDPTTGWYRSGANQWSWSQTGTQTIRLDAGGFKIIAGAVGAPSISLLTDTNTGIYWPTPDELAISAGGIQVIRFHGVGGANPQTFIPDGTVALPAIAFSAEQGTGLYSPGTQELAFAIEGAEILRLHRVGAADPQVFVPSGTAPLPGFGFSADEDTGLFRIGPNRLGFVTGGILGIELGLEGHVNLPLQPRARATQTIAQNIVSGTAPIVLAFAAEDYDVGTMHDLVTNNDRVTVPTNGNGTYKAVAQCTFDEASSATPFVADRELAITVNGTIRASIRIRAVSAGVTKIAVPLEFDLVATDIVRAAASQDSGNTMDVIDASLSVRKGA